MVPAAIFAATTIAAANLTIWLDARVDAPIGVRPDLVSDPGSAATFAAAIAAATLAFVAVVFATTLVAIQLAAGQYRQGRCGSSSAPGSPG